MENNTQKQCPELKCEPCGRLRTYSGVNSATKFCTYCAEAMCDVCSDHHQASRASLDHMVIDKPIDSGKGMPQCSIFCSEHKNKKLELYCKEHMILCCLKCMTNSHRQCDRILTVDEAAIGIKDSEICRNILNNFRKLDQEIEKSVTKGKQSVELCEHQKKVAIELVNKNREKINKSLDRLESNFKRDFPKFCKETVSLIETKLTKFEKLKALVKNSQEVLKSKIENASDVEVLLEANRLHQVCLETQKYVQDKTNNIPNLEIDFQLNECLEHFSKHFPQFGTFEVKNMDTNRPCSLTECKLEPMQTIKLLDKSCITGVTFLPDGSIALIDSRFNALYFYGVDSNKIVEIELPENPWELALWEKNTLIVSFQERPYLQMVDVTKRKLRKEIAVDEPKRGIAVYCNQLILSSKAKISVVDGCGKQVSSIPADDPLYLCVDRKGRLYYREQSHKLICCDLNGHAIFTYTHPDLKAITGIACDYENNVYLAGFGSHNIHQIAEGKTTQIFSGEGLIKPRSIYLKPDGIMLLVSNNEGKEVKIFQMIPKAKTACQS